MKNLTPNQKEKLLRLGKVLDGGPVAVLTELEETEAKLYAKLNSLESKLEAVTVAIPELADKIPDIESVIEGVKDGEKGDKGDDGKDYVLTEQDKKEIAKSIPVPVVEKVVEKIVIKETPIVTNEIVKETIEVAVLDEATVAYLEDKIETVAKTKTNSKYLRDNIGLVVRELQAGTNITIDNTNQEYPIIHATGGGGGHTIEDEGSPLTTRTKLNFVGAGVSVTDDAGDDATVVTINGGSGSGITRTIVVTSGSATLGSTASVDYVYLVAGAHTMSLPAASGNTNRYTVKNNHSANITIDTAGAENIEGAASISISPEESVDIISDGTNWFVV